MHKSVSVKTDSKEHAEDSVMQSRRLGLSQETDIKLENALSRVPLVAALDNSYRKQGQQHTSTIGKTVTSP